MTRILYPDGDAILRKKLFVKKVLELMKGRGWSKSDLARAAGLSRDRVSVYTRLNNETMPSFVNLNKIADAFGVNNSDLLDEFKARNKFRSLDAFSIKDVPGREGRVYLRINQEVDRKKAIDIAMLLDEGVNGYDD